MIGIIYEDDVLLVLDKPSGVTVNKSETTINETTIADWVEDRLKLKKIELIDDTVSDFEKRAGIVHRIDKETSGILLVAKTIQAFENLQKQFKDRVIEKTYLALVHGKIMGEGGQIIVPVGRLPWNRKKFGVLAGGKPAETKYKVLERFEKYGGLSFVKLYPKTGRTHQIRVHLKYFNHPIFSDFLYGGRKTARDDRQKLNRVFFTCSKNLFQTSKKQSMG